MHFTSSLGKEVIVLLAEYQAPLATASADMYHVRKGEYFHSMYCMYDIVYELLFKLHPPLSSENLEKTRIASSTQVKTEYPSVCVFC